MTSSTESPVLEQDPAQSHALQVDFSWKKFNALISSENSPTVPLYILHFQYVLSPNLIFKTPDDKTTIGTGTVHPVSINAKYEVHGRKGILKALKRWQTEYTHLSYAYSDSDSPVPMTWTSSSGFKTWDFICLNERQEPVARFSSNVWAVKKLGKIEFMGPKAEDPAAREEIMVTGMTLFYCMLLRTTNVLSFFGAIFARPGAIKTEK